MSNFGIDMLTLSTPHFHVDRIAGNGWTRGACKVDESKPSFMQTRSGEQLDVRHFINRSSSNFCSFDIDYRGLQIKVNPSTMLHGYNLTTELEPAYQAVKRETQALGIDLDIDTLRPGRVDVTKQAVMKFHPSTYQSALASMRATRMSTVQHPDGMEFKSGQRAIIFYNKTTQLLTEKGIVDAPDNLFRCELRYLKPKVVSNDNTGLGIATFSGLLACTSTDLLTRYNHGLNQRLFKPAAGVQLAMNFEDGVEMLRCFVQDGKRGGWKDMLTSLGADRVIEMYGSLDALEQAMLHFYGAKQARRNIDYIRNSISLLGQVQASKSEISNTIETLRQTFAA